MAGELTVIGGGKMGEALVVGLRTAGERVAVVEAQEARRAELTECHAGLDVVASVAELSAISEAVLAVKPGDVAAVCRDLVGTSVQRVLSIAAGVTIGSIETWLAPSRVAVIRAMPNTPALVGAGAAAISRGAAAGSDDAAWAARILGLVGQVVELPEDLLDAVTGVSGSGPAYVFLLAEAMTAAGVAVGLERDVAQRLVVQTILGAGRLMAETGEEPEALRRAVTSPRGTTAAGLARLEEAGFSSAVADAVAAATERSRQLGRP
jgi:pyrroline-5-carboxylate reductase